MKSYTSGVIFSSAFTGYILKLIQFFVSIVTLPIIISSLGKVQYGILVLIGQTVGFLAMSDIGVSNSVGRFFSKYYALNNTSKIQEVVNTAFFLLLITTIIILSITFLIHDCIPTWLNISDEYAEITKLLFIINGLFLALMFPTRIGQGILSGKQMYSTINLILSLVPIIQFFGIIILYKSNILGLIELAFLTLGASLLAQIIFIVIAFSKIKFLTISKIYFSKSMARKILSLGSSSLITSLSSILVSQGLIIAVGILTSTITAGIYGVVIMIVTNISFILTKISQPILTMSSELVARKKHDQLNNLIFFLMRFSLMLSILISSSLFFFIEDLLKILLTFNWDLKDYTMASKAIILMSVAMSIGIPQFVSRAVMQGAGLHWNASIGKVIASIIAFSTGIVLMWYEFGLIGASIGWSLIWILPGIFYFPTRIAKFMKIKTKKMLKDVYLPGIYLGFLLVLVGYIFKEYFGHFGLYEIIMCQSILLILALVIIFLYDKKYILEIEIIKSVLIFLDKK